MYVTTKVQNGRTVSMTETIRTTYGKYWLASTADSAHLAFGLL